MASFERRVAIDAAGQLLKSDLSRSRRIAYKGNPRDAGQQLEGIRGVQRARQRSAAIGVGGSRPRVARRWAARRLLGASPRAVGRRGGQPARRGGRRPHHELDGRGTEPRLTLARGEQRADSFGDARRARGSPWRQAMTRRREASRPVRRRARQEAKSNGRHSGHAAGGLVWYKSRLLPCHQEIVLQFSVQQLRLPDQTAGRLPCQVHR